jgi:hypothetical protein
LKATKHDNYENIAMDEKGNVKATENDKYENIAGLV